MRDQDENSAGLTRRSAIVGLGGLGVFGILASRLYYLQVVEAEDYRVLSDNNRFNFNTVIPERGRILDRYGVPLATNKQDFRLVVIAERTKDVDVTLNKIGDILPLSSATRKRIKQDIKDHAKFVPVLVDEHLDWNTFAALHVKQQDIPGIIPLEGTGRSYPHNGTFAHILGYVGKPGPEVMKVDKDELLRQPTFRIGKTGIEQSQDKVLRGKAGRKKVEVNAFGRIVREWDDDLLEAEQGKDVWLTLDAELQSKTAVYFGEESGGAVLMDVNTGELRTLLSMPTFDGNQFVSGLTQAEFRKLDTDEKRPQFNKVIGGKYPPASTFKMAVMLAALEEGIIDPASKIFCVGKIHLGNRDFHCWKKGGHGLMDMFDALKNSCDSYFYEVIQQLGMAKVKPIAEALGFAETFDLGIGGQARGVVPDPEWKKRRIGHAWRTGDELNASIGQGYVEATPLQLAVMTARIANGNKAVRPILLVNEEQQPPKDLRLNQAHLDYVRAAMRSVCSEPGGTAYRRNPLDIVGVEMAGKTGTGQVKGISASERLAGKYKNDQIQWKFRDHSIFVGYAPYDKPRFAASVLVEHGGSGAVKAANICRSMLSDALKKDGISPSDPVVTGPETAGE